jgi:ABC-type sugar transport system ATPase subunit
MSAERIARELVTGRVASRQETRAGVRGDAELLSLSDWTHQSGKFTDVSLSLGVGEIVAVVGVEGSGGRELVRSVAGFESATGTRTIAGQTGQDANRIVFVSADRADSLFENLSVAENLYIRHSSTIRSRGGLLNTLAARRVATAARRDFFVKTASLETPIRSLSGGNQQKVAIASALSVDPALVALEEPTRGVDISSKAEIHRLLRAFAERGRGVLLYCTEDSEVFDVADRALVVSRGRVVGELDCTEFDDAELLTARIARLAAGSPHTEQPAAEQPAGGSP